MKLALVALLLIPLAQPLFAQEEEVAWPRIQPLTWMDENHLAQQRQFVDELARAEFGRPVRGNKTDLDLLQRIVNQELIPQSETQNLQALGAVLGDLYVQEHGQLEWRVYEDEEGRSRAVCVIDTTNCLFPVTMLSRRMAAGLKPDVREIYQSGLQEIQPYLPRAPFERP